MAALSNAQNLSPLPAGEALRLSLRRTHRARDGRVRAIATYSCFAVGSRMMATALTPTLSRREREKKGFFFHRERR
jgi:hypothetical protein